jgi:hypothetical protein
MVIPSGIWRLPASLVVLGLGLSLLLPACAPPNVETPLPVTESPSAIPSLTATIDWFPTTSTPTPPPTPEPVPTLDWKPFVGALLLQDDFTDSSQWSTGLDAAGSVAYGNGELTLAISQPRGALISMRRGPLPANFYLEMMVSTSLCRGSDVYGLLLRATSRQDFDRVLISCYGLLRMERVKNGQVELLQDWTSSGQVPPGSPLTLRLGVWAAGSELRFFIANEYQFTLSDPAQRGGTLGVYARAAGDSPVTVSFSDLQVYALDALPTAVVGRSPTPTP